MLRYLIVISTLLILTACSELKVIGNAAMRELRADGINVEQTSFRYHQKLAALEKRGGGVLMAKREIIVDRDGVVQVEELVNKTRVTKAKKVKGLWESNNLQTAKLTP